MSSIAKAKGSCLCQKVSFETQLKNDHFHACHCNICRKWGGGPLLAVDASDGLSFTGEDHIGIYNSSEWAERGFCKNCGSHLFYRLKEGQFYNIPLGLFDNSQDLKFDLQIYVDNQPTNYSFANVTEKMTEAEVIAKFSDPG